MGMLRRSTLGFSFGLASLLGACGVVTPDDNGLFASVASGPEGGSSGAGGQGGGSGAGGSGAAPNNGSGGGPAAQTIAAADSCDNAFAINLGYGAGNNFFRGSGNTTGDTSPVEEGICSSDANATTKGPDRVHAITVSAPDGGYLTARIVRNKTEFDSVIYLRKSCQGGDATFCDDAFITLAGGARAGINGGDLLSVPIAPIESDTFFLFVDGVAEDDVGAYELEVSLNKGDCADPIPIFVEVGSPVRARIDSSFATNLMTHSCTSAGTFDLMYKVTRATSGAMVVKLDSIDSALGLTFMDQTCDGRGGKQAERANRCATGPSSFLGESSWPDAQRSIFVSVDTGVPVGAGRQFDVIFDPSGALDL